MNENNHTELQEPLVQQSSKREHDNQSFQYNTKAVYFIIIAVCLFVFNKFSVLFPLPQGQCYSDTLFNITKPFNYFFAVNTLYKNVLLVITALFTDILALSTMFLWCFKSKDPVFIIAGFLFYLVRFIIMQVFLFSYPTDYIFSDPGMKSFFVSYLKTNDFFYSGHAGFPVIAYLEYSRYKGSFIPPFALITLMMQIFLMLSLQGHYSIDLLVGSFTAYYIFSKIFRLNEFLRSKNIY